MDAYSGYNQIKMDLVDVPKTTFIFNHGKYYYSVMLFGLKNVGNYQRLMDVVFSKHIWYKEEVST